ncbi:MAG: hypothetical protein SFV81_01490 [Pirellulaceae bacterium]|nr:hypothetical protein [Pirellulaceae bacterium]
MVRSITCFTLACVLTTAIATQLRANEPPTSEETSEGEFTVHEWGTFTTFSGSDGVFLDFRPLDVEHHDLPDYVFDRGSLSSNPLRYIGKRKLRGRVRMETPVTYFYTDRHRTVDVRVEFPEGMLTEFYPPVREVLPAIDEQNIFGEGESIGKSSLNWGKIDLLPTSELVPNVTDADLRQNLTASIIHALVPHAPNEQHYASARETDSALVHYRDKPNSPSYFEKFLFYRGVGKFQLPIKTQFEGDRPVLRNLGVLPIRSAIMVDVRGDTIQAMRIHEIGAGQSLPFDQLKVITRDQLAEMVRESLVAEGLYEKEAAAMVATWQQSWFTENGTRVLYMVPGKTADELLPLHINPKPKQMLRVLVGRMEIMPPTSEQEMTKLVAASITARSQHATYQRNRSPQTLYPIPKAIATFGRMAEPALARIAKLANDASIRNEAELLISELQQR